MNFDFIDFDINYYLYVLLLITVRITDVVTHVHVHVHVIAIDGHFYLEHWREIVMSMLLLLLAFHRSF